MSPNYSIRLLIRHPAIDPQDVTNCLGISPDASWRRGQEVITPDGKRIGSVYNHTAWMHSSDFDDREPTNAIDELITRLADRSSKLTGILGDHGECFIILTLYNNRTLSFQFDPPLLKKMGTLQVKLGFELTNPWRDEVAT